MIPSRSSPSLVCRDYSMLGENVETEIVTWDYNHSLPFFMWECRDSNSRGDTIHCSMRLWLDLKPNLGAVKPYCGSFLRECGSYGFPLYDCGSVWFTVAPPFTDCVLLRLPFMTTYKCLMNSVKMLPCLRWTACNCHHYLCIYVSMSSVYISAWTVYDQRVNRSSYLHWISSATRACSVFFSVSPKTQDMERRSH